MNCSFHTFTLFEQLPQSTKDYMEEYEDDFEYPGFWEIAFEEARDENRKRDIDDKQTAWETIGKALSFCLDCNELSNIADHEYKRLSPLRKLVAQAILGKIWNGEDTGCFGVGLACSTGFYHNRNARKKMSSANRLLGLAALDMGYNIEVNIDHNMCFEYQLRTDEAHLGKV